MVMSMRLLIILLAGWGTALLFGRMDQFRKSRVERRENDCAWRVKSKTHKCRFIMCPKPGRVEGDW